MASWEDQASDAMPRTKGLIMEPGGFSHDLSSVVVCDLWKVLVLRLSGCFDLFEAGG